MLLPLVRMTLERHELEANPDSTIVSKLAWATHPYHVSKKITSHAYIRSEIFFSSVLLF